MKLADNSTLTSDEALNFVNLNLNDYALTLGSSTSDLTVQNTITIDASKEGISTGEADLILLSSLNMSQGLLGSTGGTWVLIKDFLKSGGTLSILQTNLELLSTSNTEWVNMEYAIRCLMKKALYHQENCMLVEILILITLEH